MTYEYIFILYNVGRQKSNANLYAIAVKTRKIICHKFHMKPFKQTITRGDFFIIFIILKLKKKKKKREQVHKGSGSDPKTYFFLSRETSFG